MAPGAAAPPMDAHRQLAAMTKTMEAFQAVLSGGDAPQGLEDAPQGLEASYSTLRLVMEERAALNKEVDEAASPPGRPWDARRELRLETSKRVAAELRAVALQATVARQDERRALASRTGSEPLEDAAREARQKIRGLLSRLEASTPLQDVRPASSRPAPGQTRTRKRPTPQPEPEPEPQKRPAPQPEPEPAPQPQPEPEPAPAPPRARPAAAEEGTPPAMFGRARSNTAQKIEEVRRGGRSGSRPQKTRAEKLEELRKVQVKKQTRQQTVTRLRAVQVFMGATGGRAPQTPAPPPASDAHDGSEMPEG